MQILPEKNMPSVADIQYKDPSNDQLPNENLCNEIESTAGHQKHSEIMAEVNMHTQENLFRWDNLQPELGAVLDSLPDAACIISHEGKVAIWNKAMEELTQVKAEDMVGRKNYEYSLPFYGRRQPALIDLALLTPEERKHSFPFLIEEKQVLFMERYFPFISGGAYLQCKAASLYSQNGKLIGAIETIRDISKEKEIERELKTSEARYRDILDNIEEGYYEVDLEGNYTFCNQYLQNYLGYSGDEMLGINFRKLMDEENAQIVWNNFHNVYCNHETIRELGWYVLKREGTKLYVETTVSPILENDQVVGFRGIIRDLTKRKQDQEELQASEARYRAIVEDQTEMICRFQPDGLLNFVNEAYCRYFKKQREDLIGTRFLPQILEEDRPKLDTAIAGLTAGNPVCNTELRVIVDGKVYWNYWTHRVVYDDNMELVSFQSVGRDISDTKEAVQKLQYLSMHDSLTGLYNRFYFEEEMQRLESIRHNPVALIIFDVDGLKLVNDTLGHNHGDKILISSANIISKSFRKGDVVARVGGDEFAVLLPKTPGHLVENSLKRIEEHIKKYNRDHPELPLSLSAGYAIRKDHFSTMKDIFKEADNKMYRHKLHSRQSTRSVLVQTLMKALEARDYITEGHGERLQNLVADMAKALGLPESRIKDLRLLAQFHDIGKVGVPDAILFKKGPLNPQEYAEMQRHSEIGHRIALSAPDLVLIADWILKHHEWWDGKGYPLGLKGEDIPLECRILAIADAYDAMTHNRPYRQALSRTEAIEEIKKSAGVQFDPYLVRKFMQVLGKQNDIRYSQEVSS